MKVSELIDALKMMPADVQVMVQGYEDGFDSIKIVKDIIVAKNSSAADYNGEYEDAGAGPCACPNNDAFSAVVILGNRR